METRVPNKLFLVAALACAVAASPARADALPAPAATVDAFHAALKSGDTAAALRLLTADVDIFEQGFADHTRAAYAGPHIASDAAFAQATVLTVQVRRILWFGDNNACVISQTRTHGSYQGQPIDLVGTETMLLQRAGGSWGISHIHWSAHPSDGAPQAAPGSPAQPGQKAK
jgi:ketosteroid isomerase-like protein